MTWLDDGANALREVLEARTGKTYTVTVRRDNLHALPNGKSSLGDNHFVEEAA